MLEALVTDERAIEGLPVRLVIAFVVGVATLSTMLNMVSGVGGLAVAELDARPQPDVVSPGEQTIHVTAVDTEGDPVAGATVIVRSGTAAIDGVVTNKTNESGVAAVTVAPRLAANQQDGTLTVDLKPPAGTEYVDERPNSEVLVVG